MNSLRELQPRCAAEQKASNALTPIISWSEIFALFRQASEMEPRTFETLNYVELIEVGREFSVDMQMVYNVNSDVTTEANNKRGM